MIKPALELCLIAVQWIKKDPPHTGRVYAARDAISKGDLVVVVNEKLWRKVLVRLHILRPRVKGVKVVKRVR